MKLLQRTTTNVSSNQRGLDNDGFNVPNTTITWLSIIYLIINILSNSISTFISSTPQRTIDKNNYEIRKQNFEIQLLQRVLEDSSNTDRLLSLELLASASFFRDTSGILKFVRAHDYIPQWRQRPLESYNSYSGVQQSSYYSSHPTYPWNTGLGNTVNNNTPPGNPGGSTQRMADSTRN